MKCPNDGADLTPAERDGLKVQSCPTCQGMWLTAAELNALEDERFDLGDQEKGTLVFHPAESNRLCPGCGKPMTTFAYRDYDLELEFCPDGHGFWLDAHQDKRVLELMREEELRLKWSYRAEHKWTGQLQHWRSPGFLQKLRDLTR
jgi:Zn-finger nucleic acid-binding protein